MKLMKILALAAARRFCQRLPMPRLLQRGVLAQ